MTQRVPLPLYLRRNRSFLWTQWTRWAARHWCTPPSPRAPRQWCGWCTARRPSRRLVPWWAGGGGWHLPMIWGDFNGIEWMQVDIIYRFWDGLLVDMFDFGVRTWLSSGQTKLEPTSGIWTTILLYVRMFPQFFMYGCWCGWVGGWSEQNPEKTVGKTREPAVVGMTVNLSGEVIESLQTYKMHDRPARMEMLPTISSWFVGDVGRVQANMYPHL